MVGDRRSTASEQGRIIRAYAEAKCRLDALVEQAGELGQRLERLAHGLSSHPERMLIGPPVEFLERPGDWDVVPSHPLPSIEGLMTLTNEIRETAEQVEELRERLILMGRTDLVEQPDTFFH